MIERRMLRERRFPASLIPVLAGLKVAPRPGSYCVITMNAGAKSPFGTAEVRRLSMSWGESTESFVLPEAEWSALQTKVEGAEVERGYRVLTLSPVPMGLEGSFNCVVGSMLFDAQVNARPVWSPGRFDLLVKSAEFKTTREAIDLIVSRAKGRQREV